VLLFQAMKILSKKRLRKKAGFFGKYTVMEDYEFVLFYFTNSVATHTLNPIPFPLHSTNRLIRVFRDSYKCSYRTSGD